LIYNTELGIVPYVSYATSYNPIVGQILSPGQLFRARNGVQTESASRSNQRASTGISEAALFDLKRQNVLTTNPERLAVNSDRRSDVARVELEAGRQHHAGTEGRRRIHHFRHLVSKDLNPALINTVPTNTPSEIASLWGDLHVSVRTADGLPASAPASATMAFSYADTANSLVVPSYVSATRRSTRNEEWRFALTSPNVGDKIYVGSCSTPTGLLLRAIADVLSRALRINGNDVTRAERS